MLCVTQSCQIWHSISLTLLPSSNWNLHCIVFLKFEDFVCIEAKFCLFQWISANEPWFTAIFTFLRRKFTCWLSWKLRIWCFMIWSIHFFYVNSFFFTFKWTVILQNYFFYFADHSMSQLLNRVLRLKISG